MSADGAPSVRPSADDGAAVEAVERQLARTGELLRSLSIERLSRCSDDGTSPADRAYDLAAEILARTASVSAPGVQLPRLGPHAAGDQLVLIGREFLASDEPAGPGARDLEWLTAALVALRRSL